MFSTVAKIVCSAFMAVLTIATSRETSFDSTLETTRDICFKKDNEELEGKHLPTTKRHTLCCNDCWEEDDDDNTGKLVFGLTTDDCSPAPPPAPSRPPPLLEKR